MTNDYNPNALQLTGGPLKRYLEVRRTRHVVDMTAMKIDSVEAETGSPPRFDFSDVTPKSLEDYTRTVLGDPDRGSWLTRGQWEVIILLCHEHLTMDKAAERCRLTRSGLRYRLARAKRRIERSPKIRAVIDVSRRELNIGV